MATPNTEFELHGLGACFATASVGYALRLPYRKRCSEVRRPVPIPFHRLSRLVVIGAPCFARVRGTTRYVCRSFSVCSLICSQ
jgi:hypothetical protein